MLTLILKHAILVCLAAAVSVSLNCQPGNNNDRGMSLQEYKLTIGKTLPAITSLAGVKNAEPPEITVMTKAELHQVLARMVILENPNEELKKRSQCFAEIGLIPRGYDLTTGLLELLQEQAGGLYDYHSKTFMGIYGLPPEARRVVNDAMIIAHELMHFLQDQVMDFKKHSEMGLLNIDYEYTSRAVIEGMASCIMIAYAQNTSLEMLPDLRSF